MSGDFVIRAPQKSELPKLLEIEDEAATIFDTWAVQNGKPVYEKNWPFSALPGYFENDRALIALDDREIAGFVFYKELVDKEVYILEVGVRPAYQGKKLGVELIKAAILACGSCKSASLTTYKHIPWNAPYYQRYLGFEIVEESKMSEYLRSKIDEERKILPEPDMRVAMRKFI